jgi:outer membrane autotransporter protein
LQKAIGENWHIGAAAGYEKSWLDVRNLASSEGDQVQGGAVLKGRYGGTTFSAAVSGGHGWYDAKRFVNLAGPAVTAKSEPEVNFVSGHLRLAHDFEGPAWYVRPILDGGVTYVDPQNFRENGAGAANLDVRSRNQTYWSLQPALEVGGELGRKDGWLFRPYLRAGLTHFFTGETPALSATLQGAPAGVTPFTVTGRNDKNFGDVGLGVDVLSVGGINLRLGYNGQFSTRTESHGGMLKLSLPF